MSRQPLSSTIAKFTSPSAAIDKGSLGVGRSYYAAKANLLFLAFNLFPQFFYVYPKEKTRLAYRYSKPLSKPVHPHLYYPQVIFI